MHAAWRQGKKVRELADDAQMHGRAASGARTAEAAADDDDDIMDALRTPQGVRPPVAPFTTAQRDMLEGKKQAALEKLRQVGGALRCPFTRRIGCRKGPSAWQRCLGQQTLRRRCTGRRMRMRSPTS